MRSIGLDLGEQGDFLIEKVVKFDGDLVSFMGYYGFKGWKFSNVELVIKTDEPVESPEDALLVKWDTWLIAPTAHTQLIEQGESGALTGTFLEPFEQ